MRLPSLVIFCALAAGIAAPAEAVAASATDFIRRSMEPENFRPEDYHVDYQATVIYNGETTVLDRAQTIALNEAVRHDITEFDVTSFQIVGRREDRGTLVIEYAYRYRGVIDGMVMLGQGTALAVLLRGGPAGFQWLRSIQHEKSLKGA
jgi:hypothetical protein